MRLLKVQPSTRKGKKYMAIFQYRDERIRSAHFGDVHYDDYTTNKDTARRERYRVRHASGKNAAADTPDALSYHLLWGPSTSMSQNLVAFRKRYGV